VSEPIESKMMEKLMDHVAEKLVYIKETNSKCELIQPIHLIEDADGKI